MMAVELPREEVALLFGTLTACGFLILGVLEIMWPATKRPNLTRSPRPRASRLTPLASRSATTARPAAVASRSAAVAPQSATVAPQSAAVASQPAAVAPQFAAVAPQPVAVAEQPVAVTSQPVTVAAPPTPATPRPGQATRSPRPVAPPQPASARLSPMDIARLLIERATAERDLERRVTILNRAVAGLTRAVQMAPDDEALSQMLTSTRALLWETWERIAMARLAAAMPWSGEILAAEVTPVLVRSR